MARCRPEDCNLETDNLTIIWYHNYSGGKFMANCLSLSDHGLFGHREMTEAQLKGEFSPDDKLNYLLGQIDEIRKGIYWTDLNISDNKFFGFDNCLSIFLSIKLSIFFSILSDNFKPSGPNNFKPLS